MRDCVDYGPSCPQMAVGEMTGQELPAEIESMIGVWNHERQTSEDCLVLNVWTPSTDDGGTRPVLVWLHGGGMAVGSASWPLYDFTNLARNNDVVVVGVNHRLGVLGFLDVSHLGSEFADSGNVGMLDIVAALEWVRDNIAGFGGDPSNVTIFGESGGGSKVTCLLAMPSAQGLFRSACAMSGALVEARTPEAARESTDTRARASRHRERRRERSSTLDADALVKASLASLRRRARRGARRLPAPPSARASPIIPSSTVRGGSGADVNVVLGCTTHEMVAFMGSPELFAADEATVRMMLGAMLGDASGRRVRGVSRREPRRHCRRRSSFSSSRTSSCASPTSATPRRSSPVAHQALACISSISAPPVPTESRAPDTARTCRSSSTTSTRRRHRTVHTPNRSSGQ